LALAGILWLVMRWGYGRVIASKDALIGSKDALINLYKEQLNGASPTEARARIDQLKRIPVILKHSLHA
jgi:hypothetical protein